MAMLDSIDEKLIRLLQQDARQSSDSLAKQLQVSPTTVRRKIRNLIRDETIRIVAITDPRKLGLNLLAIIALNVDNRELDSVAQTLSTLEPVRNIAVTAGRFDILVLVRMPSIEQLSNFLRNDIASMKGVVHSETFLCIEDIMNQEALSFNEMERFIE